MIRQPMLHDAATIQANHERFVSRVAKTQIVWGLKQPGGYAVCPSLEDADQDVLVFWSDRGYASRARKKHFPDYEPAEISLFDFLFRWLPGMSDDSVLAGTNWNGDLAGAEIEPADLREQLKTAMGPDRVKQYMERLDAILKQDGG